MESAAETETLPSAQEPVGLAPLGVPDLARAAREERKQFYDSGGKLTE